MSLKNSFLGIMLAFPFLVHAQESNPLIKCYADLEANPELQVIKHKVALGSGNNQTIEMLANKQKPSAQERAAILRWGRLRKECTDQYDQWLQGRYPPTVIAIQNKAVNEVKSAFASLYSGDITYGHFAKARQEISDRTRSELAVVQTQYQKDAAIQQQQQAQAEAQDAAQRRALAAQVLMNSQANQAKPYQLPPPVQPTPLQAPTTLSPRNTNCSPDGMGGVRCTTY